VPKVQHPGNTVLGGSFPKAANDKTFYAQAAEQARKTPGPEHYHRDFLQKGLADRVVGGNFSKLARSTFAAVGSKDKAKAGPAVGQYELKSVQTTPRTRGGQMSKRDRGCFFWDQAIRHSRHCQAPGKYDAVGPTSSPRTVSFSPRRQDPTEASADKSKVGPGHYNLNFAQVEATAPSYSGSKEAYRCFLDAHVKSKAHVPAPTGIPESKVVDKSGFAKHVHHILHDKEIVPRPGMGRRVEASA